MPRLMLAAASTIVSFAVVANGATRPWTSRDSAELSYFSISPRNPIGLPESGNEQVALFSPRRSRILVVSHRGDLGANSVIYTMRVYDCGTLAAMNRSAAKDEPPTLRTYELAGYGNSPAVSNYSWLSENEILFQESVADDHNRLVRWTINENHRITFADNVALVATCASSEGFGAIVVRVEDAGVWKPPVSKEGIYWYDTPAPPYRRRQYLGVSGENPPQPLGYGFDEALRQPGIMGHVRPWISPTGKYAAMVKLDTWNGAAQGKVALMNTSEVPLGSDFQLIDLATGVERNLGAVADAGAQLASARQHPLPTQAVWSSDGAHLLVMGVQIQNPPRDGLTAASRIIDCDIASGIVRTAAVFSGRLSDCSTVVSDDSCELIELDGNTIKQRLLFQYREGTGWTVGESGNRQVVQRADAISAGPNSVVAIGDANTPARLEFVSDSGRQLLLSADLRGAAFAKQTEFTWTNPDGSTESAGLLLPDKADQQRLPLVVQTYHYLPAIFLPDGTHLGTSDSAQALVAQGFAVVQMENFRKDTGDTGIRPRLPKLGPEFVARLDAMVCALAEKGIIDRNRVGLTGFSTGGYVTYYAITHPGKVRLQACVIADGNKMMFSNSYLRAAGLALTNLVQDTEASFGGPFLSHKAEWLEKMPYFNADKVVTPALFSMHGTSDLSKTHEVETIGAFRLARKPFAYLVIPDGTHALTKPFEQVSLQEATMDWMSFWLIGREDPDPRKWRQYREWRKIRSSWEKFQTPQSENE